MAWSPRLLLVMVAITLLSSALGFCPLPPALARSQRSTEDRGMAVMLPTKHAVMLPTKRRAELVKREVSQRWVLA
jgi:hypothetical protein